MRRMKIGKTGFEVSVVSMGTLSIGGDGVWGESDEAESIRTIRRACDLGINFFDTAAFYGYGRSETVLGKALAGDRDKYIVSTKCGLDWDTGEGAPFFVRDGHQVTRNLSPEGVRRSLENSLRRLKMDHVDLCITHWQAVEPAFTPIEETVGELLAMKKEGKLRAIGASNVTLDQVREYLKFGPLDLVQERFSMLSQESFRALNSFCLENGVTFHAYSPLERGLLSGAYTMTSLVKPGDARNEWCAWYQPESRRRVIELLDSWKPLRAKYGCTQAALTVAWTLAQAPNVNVDSGARRVAVIEENAAGADLKLDPDDVAAMNRAIDKLLQEKKD
ncbi:MAG: aldo/keto reductase [Synergistaceae bacterium]|nr:aldo/keto reductase [Synergistaceae bacterium]